MNEKIIATAYREKKATAIVAGILLLIVVILFGVGIYILIDRTFPNSSIVAKIIVIILFVLIAILVDVLYFVHIYKQNRAKENVITYDLTTRTFYIETKKGVRKVHAKAIVDAYLESRHALYNGSFLSSSYSKNGPIIINIAGEKKIKSYVVNDVQTVNSTIKHLCGIKNG